MDKTKNKEIRKATGAHYTPSLLAEFVSTQIFDEFEKTNETKKSISILDPACGDGELLFCILNEAKKRKYKNIKAFGFDIDKSAAKASLQLIRNNFPNTNLSIRNEDFLEWATSSLQKNKPEKFDIIIANPPYVRTQVLGSKKAKELSEIFNLSGRIDLYHAFLVAMRVILLETGVAGVIVSNRFLSTQSGKSVRKDLITRYKVAHVWDFGDTKLFDAAVLPAVLILSRNVDNRLEKVSKFTSIYLANKKTTNPTEVFDALSGKASENFKILEGSINFGDKEGDIWTISNKPKDLWLNKVKKNTKLLFGDIGKIRVGIKTTSDNVFIVTDTNIFNNNIPETLKPLITHHVARRYQANTPSKHVVYTHEVIDNKKIPIDLEKYPNTKKYLESNKDKLSERKYIINSGRNWYEIWVPHNPLLWKKNKLVFRDISERPIFWIDQKGSIVNGDCYWMTSDSNDEILWLLLGIANSKFIEEFYDHSFNNKLYSGRRRFITQYVKKFPVPDVNKKESKKIIELTKKMYNNPSSPNTEKLEKKMNELVYSVFGLL